MREIEDTYKNGQYIRRWSWVNGEARCVENAVAVDVADMTVLLANNQFVRDIQEYDAAVERLSRYTLADGRPEIIEPQPTGEQVWDEVTQEMVDVMHDVVVQTVIDPLPATVEVTTYSEDDPMAEPVVSTIENPEITRDNAERLEAQAVVDATPLAVKEAA